MDVDVIYDIFWNPRNNVLISYQAYIVSKMYI